MEIPSLFKWKWSVTHILLMGILMLSFTSISFSIGTFGMPRVPLDSDRKVINGQIASNELAWSVLNNITSKSHSSNTEENQRVKKYLIEIIEKLIEDSKVSNVEISQEQTNVIVNPYKRHVYFQSDNIVVRIKGASTAALLVSSHFDSANHAKGATDAGIGIAVMISVFQALLRASKESPLNHTVIFNFNNSEEDYLLGSAAFTKHPWFNSIKAFINLEGTGAAPHRRSAMFRTNSELLTKKVMQDAPYPHYSVLFNSAMKYIASDTDFRCYGSVGRLPGLDYAFYTFRYLYHTVTDDVSHCTRDSVQHMNDNTLQAVRTLIDDPTFLENIQLEKKYEAEPWSILPVPDFSFFDRFGVISIYESQNTFIFSHLFLLVVLVSAIILKGFAVLYSNGAQAVVRNNIKPALDAFLLVCTIFWSVTGISFIFSFIKRKINPTVVYGHPEISFLSIVALVFSWQGIVSWLWPKISSKLNLTSSERRERQYEQLPSDQVPEDEGTVDEIINDSEETDEDEESIIENTLEGPESTDHGWLHNFVNTKKSRSLTIWLPVGLTLFWGCAVVVSLILAMHGMSVLFFLYDYFLFSLVSFVVGIAAELIYRNLLREDLAADYTSWEEKFIIFYQSYFWILQVILSTAVPFIFMVDIIRQLFDALPSLIIEGLADETIEIVFTMMVLLLSINFLPLISKSARRNSSLLLFAVFLSIWGYQLSLFPYAKETPFKFGVLEKFEIGKTFSNVTILLPRNGVNHLWVDALQKKGLVPTNTTIAKNEITFSRPFIFPMDPISVNVTRNGNFLRGNYISNGSRVCDLTLSNYGTRADFWLESEQPEVNLLNMFNNQKTIVPVTSQWIQYETGYMNPITHVVGEHLIQIYRRPGESYQNIQFVVRTTDDIQNITISIDCHYEISDYSEFYRNLLANKPEWSVEAISGSRGGSLTVRKTVSA